MAKKDNDLPAFFRIHCNRCDNETVHDVLAGTHEWIHKSEEIHSKETLIGDQLRLICMCQGCGSKCFASVVDVHGTGFTTVRFPYQVKRKVPRWYAVALVEMTWSSIGLLSEIYDAFHANAYRLCAMGIRSMFEQMFVEKVGEHGSFHKNLSEFQKQGYISAIEKEVVSAVLDIGHAATHRAHTPDEQDIGSMLDILEHQLQSLYVNKQLSTAMAKSPPRMRKTEKKE